MAKMVCNYFTGEERITEDLCVVICLRCGVVVSADHASEHFLWHTYLKRNGAEENPMCDYNEG